MEMEMETEADDMKRFVSEVCTRSPHGSDLLITAFVHSLRSFRRSSVCRPFPTVHFHSSEDLQEKDYEGAWEALQDIPDLESISLSSPATKLTSSQEILSSENIIQRVPLKSLKLLHWILNFNYQLELVEDPEKELTVILPHSLWGKINSPVLPNFVFRAQRAGMERAGKVHTDFEVIKHKIGTIYAYHGTSAENLHSILRCGLLNMSKTSLQQNGAMFGEGVYFSTDLTVALSFSKSGEGWRHSSFGANLKYVLVCEIARDDSVLFVGKNNQILVKNKLDSPSCIEKTSYIVVPNSDLLRIRYILVYGNSSLQTINSKMRTDVDRRTSVEMGRWRMKRHDFCKLLIVLYVGLLLVVSYMKSFSSSKAHKR